MNIYLKPVSILSAIIGAVLGVLLLFPFFTFNIFVCFLFSIISLIVILYLKKNALVGILEPKDGAIIGAIVGFVSIAVTSVVYVPLFWAISSLFKGFGDGIGISAAATILIQNFNIFLALMYFLIFGMLGAMFNSFTGLITVFIYEKLDTSKPEDTTHFVIEED